jgi:hypothetical protein
LSSIADFVAGANDFGTLAALCQTSRLMLQECERTLYETVEWDESLMERFEEGKRTGQYPRQFDYIEYVGNRQYPEENTILT